MVLHDSTFCSANRKNCAALKQINWRKWFENWSQVSQLLLRRCTSFCMAMKSFATPTTNNNSNHLLSHFYVIIFKLLFDAHTRRICLSCLFWLRECVAAHLFYFCALDLLSSACFRCACCFTCLPVCLSVFWLLSPQSTPTHTSSLSPSAHQHEITIWLHVFHKHTLFQCHIKFYITIT